jgi:anti-sigma regulatory factor (Ser/Thr protein kinase)
MTGQTFRHEALIYDDDEKFVAALTPFLAEGLRRREAAVAALPGHNIDLLRRSLGAAAERVTFIDRDAWYQRPASTIAGWKDLVDAAMQRGHPSVRIVGEVAFGPCERHDSWTRYESAVNDVFATVPAWVICPYDTRRLPHRVVHDAQRTHPDVALAGRGRSELYQEPGQLLRIMGEPLPPVSGPPLVMMSLTDPPAVRRARRAVEAIARHLGWQHAAIGDLLLVVSEVARNSLAHGGGDRRMHVWVDRAAITCEVTDDGDGPTDPLIGYRPPENPCRGGAGLWIANQLSDWLAIEHRDGVTRVRFRCVR